MLTTLVMGVSDARSVARAGDLGVAMQLTHIARDVGEDARMGRLYLPRTWFVEAGLDADEWLAAPRDDVRDRAMTRRLLGYADFLHRRCRRRATGWTISSRCRTRHALSGVALRAVRDPRRTGRG